MTSIAAADRRTKPAFSPARAWLATAIAFGLATPLSYVFLDRLLATLSYNNLRPWRKIFDAMTRVIEPFPVIALGVFAVAIVLVARQQAIGAVIEKLLRVSAALFVAGVAKDQFKFAFGRTWPETWVANNPSFFRDGAYGFSPFHGGQGWYAFPSGHTTAAFAVATSLWVLWPRGRPLYALGALVVVVGLIGADYHWLSDIIAGAGLGAAVGTAAARIGPRESAAPNAT